jgi:hypothetical protein
MGMNAEIIGVGVFRRGIVPHLQYPADFYANTRDGVNIVESIFVVETGSTESRQLASCFGIDPWDFNRHELDATAANIAALGELFDDKEVQRFKGLRDAGFKFFFLPNG